jgi:hypothetical protein
MGLDSGSPDDADALALTFAMPVALPKPKPRLTQLVVHRHRESCSRDNSPRRLPQVHP